MAAPPTNKQEFKLRPDIQISKQNGEVILVGEFRRGALRLAGTSGDMIDLLAVGCSRIALCDHLRTLGYSAGQVEPEIDAFLSRLSSAGVLQSEVDPVDASRNRWNINVDPMARLFARLILLLPSWVAISLGSLALTAATASIVAAASKGRLLSLPPDFAGYSAWGLLGIIPWILLHEFSHAVACRSIGFRVSGLGMRFRKWGGPSFFVDTRYVALSSNRWAKTWVALAGPFMDIILLGLVSLMILSLPRSAKLASCSRLLFLVMSGALFFNLNPWRVSDGSNAASMLAKNPHLLENALSFRDDRKIDLICFGYRIIAFSYLLFFAAVAGYCMYALIPAAGKWLR